MAPVGYDLWFFPESLDFGESIAGSDLVAPLPPETVILKAIYLSEADVGADGLEQAIRRLTAELIEGAGDIYLLRPIPSTDGPPFRACLIYRRIQAGLDVDRLDPRFDPRYVPSRRVRTIRYNTIKTGGAYPWERDFEAGGQACFLTGKGATATWRLARLETDALGRQVLTLAPVRLPHAIAVPNLTLFQIPSSEPT